MISEHIMETRMTLQEFRNQMPITEECIYFQTGTASPTPGEVLEAVDRIMRFQSRYGPANPEMREQLYPQVFEAKSKLASLLNTSSEELAWVTNTTQGMQLIVRGLSWKEGDEVIISSAEHISSRVMWKGLAQRYGMTVTVVPTGETDETFLEALKKQMTARTRLVSISHVSTLDGRRLPVTAVSALAREQGIPTLIDGAQAIGQFPVDLREIGCDFYTASGHKWLFGPVGLGFVYVARPQLPEISPYIIPEPEDSADYQRYVRPLSAGVRIELGTSSSALPIGLGTAVDLVSTIGLETIEAHTSGLVEQLRTGLEAIDEVEFVTPEPQVVKGSALLSFVLHERDADAIQHIVRTMLERHRIVIKHQQEICGIRLSPACFNTDQEVAVFLRSFQEMMAA